jgi:hypothetical protein
LSANSGFVLYLINLRCIGVLHDLIFSGLPLHPDPKTLAAGKRIRGEQKKIPTASFVRFASSSTASPPPGAASEQAENDDAARLREG